MPRLSCGIKSSRVILILLNLFFLLFGLTIWGLGMYVKFNGNFRTVIEVYEITETIGGKTMGWVGVGMIVVGILTSGLAVFGCLGAGYKNRCFLYGYALLILSIVLVEFAAVIVILQYRNDLWQSYDTGFKKVFQDAYNQNTTATIDIIEHIERQFKCCGVDSYLDYDIIHQPYPLSCYPNQIRVGPPFIKGCATGVIDWAWNELPIIAGAVGVILFFEIFGIVLSLVLGVAISHSPRDEYEPLN